MDSKNFKCKHIFLQECTEKHNWMSMKYLMINLKYSKVMFGPWHRAIYGICALKNMTRVSYSDNQTAKFCLHVYGTGDPVIT